MSTKVDSNSMFSTTKAMNKMSTGVDINKKWRNFYIKVVSKMSTSVDCIIKTVGEMSTEVDKKRIYKGTEK